MAMGDCEISTKVTPRREFVGVVGKSDSPQRLSGVRFPYATRMLPNRFLFLHFVVPWRCPPRYRGVGGRDNAKE
eukprot:1181969-Prorocentrum_minimum.AAC.1